MNFPPAPNADPASPGPDRPRAASPPPSRAPAAPTQATRVSMARIFQPYLERIWLVLLLALLGGGGSFLYGSRLPRIYSATATIQAETRARRVLGNDPLDQGNYDEATVNTVAQKVCSLAVLEEVVRTNRLVEAAARAGMSNVTESSLAAALRRNATSKLRRDTRLIDVTIESTNGPLAARLANGIVQEFLRRQLLVQSEFAMWGSEALFKEARDLDARLRESERRLQEFREKNRLVSIEEQQKTLGARLDKLQQELTEVEARRQQAESDQRAIPSGGRDLNEMLAVASVANDSSVIAARQQYAGLQLAFSGATNRYKPAHPKFLQAYQQLTNGYAVLVNSAVEAARGLEQRVAAGREAEQRIRTGIDAVQRDIQRVNALSAQFGELQRQVETDTAIQQSVLKRIKELELSKDLTLVPISLVEPALEPRAPLRPHVPSLVLRGILAGTFLALACIYFLQSLDSSLRTVDEAEERLGISVLGAVAIDRGSSSGPRRLVVADDPGGLAAEGFRSLTTSAGLLGRPEDLRVQLITSAVPSEGKTFCSINYASALASLGQKVVLVDCDLRRPAVGHTLGIDGQTP
ncbi:MAG: GumC family protein, partial [Verrucomicrobiota bacterium]